MSILVIAEHDGKAIKAGTLNAVTAAQAIGGEIHLLVAGSNCGGAAEAAARIAGVAKVLVADDPALAHALPENLAPAIAALAEGYGHLLAPASSFGKNVMPRVAALLRSEEHTSELQSLMRTSYAVFGLKKKQEEKINTSD